LLNRFHLLLITSKAVAYAFVICGEMRAEHSGRLFHRCWREWPT